MTSITSDREVGSLQFEVDASILVQLGEQLVTRRSLALAELIKNAYDADATYSRIIFENVANKGGKIIVSDDGLGMTLTDVQQNWMRLATIDKLNNPSSVKYSRRRTGQKGIGRFAARRLSNILLLDSVATYPDGTKKRILVEFDWANKFSPGEELTQIPVAYVVESVPDTTPTGVTLHLEDVIESWAEDDIVELRKDLITIINPFQEIVRLSENEVDRIDPGFQISIRSTEYPDFQGELSENFLSAAWAVLTGKVDREGNAVYRLTINETGENLELVPSRMDFDQIADVDFEIRYFVYKAEHFDKFDFGVRDASRIGREQGGVRIYLDSFRVFPYGDSSVNDDWLDLDSTRAGRTTRLVNTQDEVLQSLRKDARYQSDRPELLIPGNNQVFGSVQLYSASRNDLQITSNREGFLENTAFRQLRRFVQTGIWWMTLQYSRITYEERERRRQERQEKKEPSPSERVKKTRQKLQKREDIPDETKKELDDELEALEKEVEEREYEHIDELSLLRVLSATGTTVSMMNHQLRSMLIALNGVYTDLSEIRPSVSVQDGLDKFDRALAMLNEWKQVVKLQVSQLGFLLGDKAQQDRKRLPVRQLVNSVAEPLAAYMRDYGIQFTNEVSPNIKTPYIFESEMYAILLHVFTNALKAVREIRDGTICVQAIQEDSGIYIDILDNGVGIPESERETVFQAFKTTTGTPDPVWGVGTGLGLKVVRDMLANYNGTAKFIEADLPWKTCLQIYLPK